MNDLINNITYISNDDNIRIKYTYENDINLNRYLDDLSYLLYGVGYYELTFLNGNPTDFSKSNILINN